MGSSTQQPYTRCIPRLHTQAPSLPYGGVLSAYRSQRHAHVSTVICLCLHNDMPMSPQRHAHVSTTTCPCLHSDMPISPQRHAHVSTTTCLYLHSDMPMSPQRHAYISTTTCLYLLSDMPISPQRHGHVSCGHARLYCVSPGSKTQQVVTVILILLLAQLNLPGQALTNGVHQRIKLVKNGNNALLLFR